MIAWIPMLPADDRAAADAASAALDAQAQFWDGEGKLGAEVGRSLGIDGWVAWDIYLFYPPGARWDDHLPAPSVAIAQSTGVVIATKGALPAAGDAEVLPARWRDRADVVGEQADLEQLLARAAQRAAAMTTTSSSPPTTR
jgi:hypothetical protein